MFCGFNKYFYLKALENNGFQIDSITPNGNYFEYMGQELNRLPAIGAQYAGRWPKPLEKLAIKIILKMLQKNTMADKASSDILSFGLHIKATKK